jgi:hypothetical protein
MSANMPLQSQGGSDTPSKSQMGTKPPNQKIINKYLQHYDMHNASSKRRINSDARPLESQDSLMN